jgi:hypothetical protein
MGTYTRSIWIHGVYLKHQVSAGGPQPIALVTIQDSTTALRTPYVATIQRWSTWFMK